MSGTILVEQANGIWTVLGADPGAGGSVVVRVSGLGPVTPNFLVTLAGDRLVTLSGDNLVRT